MARPPRTDVPTIGWREWVALPGVGVAAVKAKIDTGARSSAIHAFDIVISERRGRTFASFRICPKQRSTEGAVEVEAEIVDERWVRSSTGHRQRRLVVLIDIALMGRTWTSEVTLAQRDQMGFRLLLGREALRRRFLVDPSASYRGGRPARNRPVAPGP